MGGGASLAQRPAPFTISPVQQRRKIVQTATVPSDSLTYHWRARSELDSRPSRHELAYCRTSPPVIPVGIIIGDGFVEIITVQPSSVYRSHEPFWERGVCCHTDVGEKSRSHGECAALARTQVRPLRNVHDPRRRLPNNQSSATVVDNAERRITMFLLGTLRYMQGCYR